MINDDYRNLHKADMFALGATLYELAKGMPLPTGVSLLEERTTRLPRPCLQDVSADKIIDCTWHAAGNEQLPRAACMHMSVHHA